MRKRTAAIAAALVLVLSACGAPADEPNKNGEVGEGISIINVNTPGGSVECITYKDYNAGGISCNWDNVGRTP